MVTRTVRHPLLDFVTSCYSLLELRLCLICSIALLGQVKREDSDSSALGRDALKAEMMGLSPGLFYARPTRATLDLVDLITSRLLARPSASPKLIFNEVPPSPPLPFLKPVHIGHKTPGTV